MRLNQQDREAIAAYRKKRGEGPFIAADAAVVSSDERVLLVRRSKPPGTGLLALPGGFVEQDETFLQAAKRELFEETGLALPSGELPELRPEGELLRDAPDRDPRARIVSIAYLFRLAYPAAQLLVRGGDDAADATWLPLEETVEPAEFYADHFLILRDFGL